VRRSAVEARERRATQGERARQNHLGVFHGRRTRPPTAAILAYIDVYKIQFGARADLQGAQRSRHPDRPEHLLHPQDPTASTMSRSVVALPPGLKGAYEVNYSCYGARKLWRQLGSEGIQSGHDKLARLMRITGIRERQTPRARHHDDAGTGST